MERYRRVRGEHLRKGNNDLLKTRIIRQTIASVVIFASVFAIKLLDTDTANTISENIKKSLSYTVDYRATVEEIFGAINDFARDKTDEITNNADVAD